MSENEELNLLVQKTGAIADAVRLEIVELCNEAFTDPFDGLFSFLPPHGIHVFGRLKNRRLVSHAVATERRFFIGDLPEMKAAYVDAVATLPALQRRGYGAQVMARLIDTVSAAFDVAGLSTFIAPWYASLGWETWRGPLALRNDQGVTPTPEEKATVMIHRLPKTPELNLADRLVATWRPGGGW